MLTSNFFIDQQKRHSLSYLKQLIKTTNDIYERYDKLLKENQRLRGDAYKDEELTEMQKKIDELQKRLNDAFEIPPSAKEWMEQHSEKKHPLIPVTKDDHITKMLSNYHSYTFTFTPTHLADCCEVKCSCGDKFEWYI